MEQLSSAIRKYTNGEYITLLAVCMDFPKMDKALIVIRDENDKGLCFYPNAIELYKLCPISYLVADVLEIQLTWYENGSYEYQIKIQRGDKHEIAV